jgi:cytochrome oxidase Cu insertion factor (SCO1/SenC/PrrC family)
VRRVVLCGIVLGVAAAAGASYAIGRSRGASPAILHPAAPASSAAATWRAGARRAPNFTLVDQHGKPISMLSLRGRPVVVTFIDPVCRDLCPFEAKVLMAASRRLPASQRPVIVSVSVNPWADTKTNFAVDAVHWRLGANWRWALGGERELATVWRRYQIGVQVLRRVVSGISLRTIVHTEASYIVDRSGYERALFLYPFSANDVERALRAAARS